MGLGQSTQSDEWDDIEDECEDPLLKYPVINTEVLKTKGWITSRQGLPVYVTIKGLGGCYFWGHRCYASGVRTAAVQPLDPLAKPDPTTGVANMFIGPMREVPYERVKFVDMLIEKFMPEQDMVRIIAKEQGTSTPITWQWQWSKMQHVAPDSPEADALNILRTDFPETANTAYHPVNPPMMRTDTHAVRTMPTQPGPSFQPQPQPRQPRPVMPAGPSPGRTAPPTPQPPRQTPTPTPARRVPVQPSPPSPAPSPLPQRRAAIPPQAPARQVPISPPPPPAAVPAAPSAAEAEEITAFRIVDV